VKRLRASAASLRAGLDAFQVLFGTGASSTDREEYIKLLRQQAMQQEIDALEPSTAAPQIPGSDEAFPGRTLVVSSSSTSQ
jgi:hypothetical protein